MPVGVFIFSEQHAVDIEPDDVGIPFQAPDVIVGLQLVWEIILFGDGKMLFNIALVFGCPEDVDIGIEIVAVFGYAGTVLADVDLGPPLAVDIAHPKARHPRGVHAFELGFKIAVEEFLSAFDKARCMGKSLAQFRVAMLVDLDDQLAVVDADIGTVEICRRPSFPFRIVWIPPLRIECLAFKFITIGSL